MRVALHLLVPLVCMHLPLRWSVNEPTELTVNEGISGWPRTPSPGVGVLGRSAPAAAAGSASAAPAAASSAAVSLLLLR
jgi:hypothetical protein